MEGEEKEWRVEKRERRKEKEKGREGGRVERTKIVNTNQGYNVTT